METVMEHISNFPDVSCCSQQQSPHSMDHNVVWSKPNWDTDRDISLLWVSLLSEDFSQAG